MKLGFTELNGRLFPNLKGLDNFFRLNDFAVEMEQVYIENENSIKQLEQQEYKYIRIDSDSCASILKFLKIVPENVRFSGLFDCFVLENNRLTPRLYFFDLLRKYFVQKFRSHKINEAVVILTHEEEQKAFITFALGLGHKQIIVVNESGVIADLEHIKNFNIGVDVKAVKAEDLTQIDISTSLMINTLDLEKKSTLLTDLAYFNFMSKEGIVIELQSHSPVNPLLFEAEKARLRSMGRKEFISFYEFQTLNMLSLIGVLEKDYFFENYSEIMTIDQ